MEEYGGFEGVLRDRCEHVSSGKTGGASRVAYGVRRKVRVWPWRWSPWISW